MNTAQKKIYVIDPSDNNPIGSVPIYPEETVKKIVEDSANAFYLWRNSSASKRKEYLKMAACALLDKKEEYAKIISKETGKPYSQAITEVVLSVELLNQFASEALQISGEYPQVSASECNIIIKEPIGPVAIINSYNYPLYLMIVKLAPAIAAGCTVVVKPSELAPLACCKFIEEITNPIFDNNVVSIVTGDGQTGKYLIQQKMIRKICFTGQKDTALKIFNSINDIKSITCELGGISPAVIDKNIDIQNVAKEVVSHSFRNAGQYCHRICHVYIHEDIYEEFTEALVNETKKIKIGRYDEKDVYYGPLKTHELAMLVENRISDALKKGAEILHGGKRANDRTLFFPPTILGKVDNSMDIINKETFGPVISVIKFNNIHDLVNRLNQYEYGLSSYIYSKNIESIFYFMRNIETGMVHVNKILRTFQLPFGGCKNSGFGRERSKHSLNEFLYLKSVSMYTGDGNESCTPI